MIVKAIALVCIVHSTNPFEKSCPTIVYENTFSSVEECSTWLLHKRLYNMKSNERMALKDCVITKRTDG